MKQRIKNIGRVAGSLVIITLLTVVQARAEVVTFDDLTTGLIFPPSYQYGIVPASYANLNWGNGDWEVMAGTYYNGAYGGLDNGAVSTPNFAYPASGGLSAITGFSPVNQTEHAVGAWFAAFVSGSTAPSVTVKGYLANSLVGTASMTLSGNGAWQYLSFGPGFANVDKITVDGTSGKYLRMDNLAAVPEAATWLTNGVIVLAIGGVFWYYRRKALMEA
jgi:hypothetical protein